MNSNNDTKKSQEIDLGFLWQQLMQFLDGVVLLTFKSFRFFIKNIIVFILLLVVGIGIGYFLDHKKTEHYKHEVILTPNFESNSYLYEKVKNIDRKVSQDILLVEVTPIVDLFNFLSSAPENLKMAEFMSENNVGISVYKPGNQTEKIYKYHLLTIHTKKEDSDGSIVRNFLEELNKEKYFLERQKIEQENTSREIKESLTSIQNINAVFERFGNPSSTSKSDLNIEMHPEINGLLYSKQLLLTKLNKLKTSQIEQTKIFYDVSILSNIKVKFISNMIIIPAVLVFLFIIFAIIKGMYRRYHSKIILD